MDSQPSVYCQNPVCPQVKRFNGPPRFIGAFVGRGRCDRCGKWTLVDAAGAHLVAAEAVPA